METRPELAAKDLLQALAEEPESAYIHGLLAGCLKVIAGAVGLGALSAAAQLKEKKKVREKMMKDAGLPGDSKKN